MRAKTAAWLAAACCLANPARAEWLQAGGRAISRGDSADPDAPVTGYAFGPRARASLGLDLALLSLPGPRRSFRWGLVGLVAFDAAYGKRALPSQLGRSLLAFGPSWAFHDPFATLPTGHELELDVELGRKTAFSLDELVLADRYRPSDVPFGAGGTYLGLAGGLSTPLGARTVFSSRLTLRSFINALPDAVGQTEASDYVASGLQEGAELSAALELGARFRLAPKVEPVLRAYADVIEPHDDSAKTLWLARVLVGLALPGAQFELEPFFDAEVGHGQGLLVNRSQWRFGLGARLYAR